MLPHLVEPWKHPGFCCEVLPRRLRAEDRHPGLFLGDFRWRGDDHEGLLFASMGFGRCL